MYCSIRKLYGYALTALLGIQGCGNSPADTGCLSTGDFSCLDWSDGQDAHVVSLPSNERGDGLVAYSSQGNYLDSLSTFGQVIETKLAQNSLFVATAEPGYDGSMSPQVTLQGNIVSKDKWITITQDVSYGKRVGGCVNNRVTLTKRNTRITLKGQKKPLLDIHSVTYNDEAGRICWGVYDSGDGSTGPGVCYCEDKNNPAPPEARESAVRQELSTFRPPEIDYRTWALAAGICAMGVVVAMNAATGG